MVQQPEDSLNYHLIMEGFYYDAEIEYIAEVIKNELYFAVLEGENNKIIKSTHDTYYFSIDDVLVYINYYFDFGPLNISCLYKYCCNLNSSLQYSQGFKRVVHYTTANPIKRVNAALLMGCYAIIYLKMEPKDVYRILLTTGGPFKTFVDASQGLSQYTIHLLDCFHAIKKALTFNFFNFDDFNMEEYDIYDKLQNGDMNWLLPRKFLAFIGPTDNEFMNGHPPDFYIKYFLENDIKTVIRLNNKVYDASVFTHVGIEHHELFFPDGTVPTKQILLRFLELSETARAATAVHCKAGLGRTGSLIGAYIIKHYHFTAREVIAWMRICRPGSVIGQQQGWLEKIESWLWRQGNMYRLQHFGEGDRIPHHKYGIYSKEWPKEREKLIRHVQRRKLEAQGNNSTWYTFVQQPLLRLYNPILPFECPVHSCMVMKKPVAKSYYTGQKSSLTLAKDERSKRPPKMLNKMQGTPQFGVHAKSSINGREPYTVNNATFASSLSPEESSSKSKQHLDLSKRKERLNTDVENQPNRLINTKQKRYMNATPSYYEVDEPKSRNRINENKSVQSKIRKRNQSDNRDLSAENRPNSGIKNSFIENVEKTQGDKLNDIKANRLAKFIEGQGSESKMKQYKTRKRSITPTTKLEVYSPKQQQDLLQPPVRRSHPEHRYASRN